MPELALNPADPSLFASEDFLAQMQEAGVVAAWINNTDTREIARMARMEPLPGLGGLAVRGRREWRQSSSNYYSVATIPGDSLTLSDTPVSARDIRNAAREQQRTVLYLAGGRVDRERIRDSLHRAAYMQRGPFELNNGQWFSLLGGGGLGTGMHVIFNATELSGYLPAAVTGIAAASLLLEPLWEHGQRYFDNQKIGGYEPIVFIR